MKPWRAEDLLDVRLNARGEVELRWCRLGEDINKEISNIYNEDCELRWSGDLRREQW